MIRLSNCFEKIFIISLDVHEDRRSRLLSQLKEQGVYEPKVEVIRACHGDTVGVPAWWKSGGGAWGCLQSHSQVIQRAALDGLDNFLVLEDDAVLSDNFDEHLQKFWPNVPEDWEQLYLGGQHLLEPIPVNKHWLSCKDVNRTHAYALKRSIYKKVYAHINHAPDYMSAYSAGWSPHFDHQLGKAHKRGDWKVHGLKTWLFGQGENHSWINGRWHPSKWWDWPEGDCFRYLPYVIIENDGLFSQVRGKHWRGKSRHGEVAKNLHFGWDLAPNKLSTVAAWKFRGQPARLSNTLDSVAREAFECRRLPAFYGDSAQVDFVRRGWPGGTVTLKDLEKSGSVAKVLSDMTNYPDNGLLELQTK